MKLRLFWILLDLGSNYNDGLNKCEIHFEIDKDRFQFSEMNSICIITILKFQYQPLGEFTAPFLQESIQAKGSFCDLCVEYHKLEPGLRVV